MANSETSKTLIIVRHAHRDTDEGRALDNGLSSKGKKQAENLRSFFSDRFGGGAQATIYSSPKKRCVETVERIAKDLGVSIRRTDALNESETKEDLQRRIDEFFRKWKRSRDALTLVSSHGDWIPAFLERATGCSIELKKSGWAELVEEAGKIRLVWLLQKTKI